MRGFIEELRHRNVIRVGIAYIVAGWLIAQVADLAADAFHAPEWFMQMLIILLLIGLPIALFLAWAYELTPDGVKKAADVPADAPKDPRSGHALNRLIIAALIVAIGGLVWERMSLYTLPANTAADEKSIAVLPFEDFSPDSDHAWFADGLTEEILNSLARTPDLQIASRTSSFAFRGATDDIPAIAAQLGVAHILEGSVRRAGDRLRVTAQLIRASDDKHLWSENFDGSSDDSIEIQERIAFEIASALETAMDPEELAKMMSAGTRSIAAWETYLRALAHYQRDLDDGGRGNIFATIDLLDQAVEIDPGFAEAYLLLSEVWQSQIDVTSTIYVSGDPPLAERRSKYRKVIGLAAKHARTKMMRLKAEYSAAKFDYRFTDQMTLATEMTALTPDDFDSWSTLAYEAVEVGDYKIAREAALHAWTLEDNGGSYGKAMLIEILQRASVNDVPDLVEKFLQEKNRTPNDLYQSHRALLAAELTERAAQVADQYLRMSEDNDGKAMVQIRQACAEGRIADADSIYTEAAVELASGRWLIFKTLGRDDDAREFLRPFDTPETLSVMTGYLGYRSFEARDFPVLWSALAADNVERPPERPLAYRCER